MKMKPDFFSLVAGYILQIIAVKFQLCIITNMGSSQKYKKQTPGVMKHLFKHS